MTVYTYELVEKRLGFKQFAMRCARVFGALIEMRDHDMDAPIPDQFIPSDYHIKAKTEAEATLKHFQSLSLDKAIAAEKIEVADTIARLEKSQVDESEKNAYMLGVLEDVQKWTTPTPDHDGLKKFMADQITMSLDGSNWYDKEINRLKSSDLAARVRDRIDKAEKDIIYHNEEYRKECERAAERTKWVRDLRDSLNNRTNSVAE